MTDRNELHAIKTIAKRLARARRIAHHEALDLIARELKHAHWRALTVAWDKGWRPFQSQVEMLPKLEAPARPYSLFSFPTADAVPLAEYTGEIDGQPYAIEIDFEVLMYGRGWTICVEQAPFEKPQIEMDRRIKANPILDPKFREKALQIANESAEMLRAGIARDWPRRSTKPDANGCVVHPLWADREPSSEWCCLHCDGTFTGAQMAASMWHCPECGANPIDIFVEPFWKAAS